MAYIAKCPVCNIKSVDNKKLAKNGKKNITFWNVRILTQRYQKKNLKKNNKKSLKTVNMIKSKRNLFIPSISTRNFYLYFYNQRRHKKVNLWKYCQIIMNIDKKITSLPE